MPLYDNSGRVIGILGWFADITEMKELQMKIIDNAKNLSQSNKKLNQLNKQLELANIDLENFTYAASHDLQAPLIGIKSGLQIIEKKHHHQLDEQSKNILSGIIDSSEQMKKLVKDILTYARTGTKNALPDFADVNKIVAEKINSLEYFIKKHKANFSIQLPDEDIYCYPQLLGLVFYNLFNNAIKFNKSTKPFIDVKFEEDKDFWIFKVCDNGIGIDEKYRTTIFTAFNRLHSNSQYDGSGIGLSICKRVINIHKGEIWITDNINGGSIFNFSISKNIK